MITAAPVPPIPPLSSLPCCWQSEELITLDLGEGPLRMRSVVAWQADTLSLVVLDSLGHRQLTLVYEGGGIGVLSVPKGWDERFNQYLLAAHFLHSNTTDHWVAGNSDWTVRHGKQEKTLLYRGKTQVELRYARGEDALLSTRKVRFSGHPQTLEITPLSMRSL